MIFPEVDQHTNGTPKAFTEKRRKLAETFNFSLYSVKVSVYVASNFRENILVTLNLRVSCVFCSYAKVKIDVSPV